MDSILPAMIQFIKEEEIEKIVKLINDSNYVGMQDYYSKEMLAAFPLENASNLFNNIKNQKGIIVKYGPSKIVHNNQVVYPLYFERGVMDLKLVFDVKKQIIGLWIYPHVTDIPVIEKHETKFSLPFKGSWLVYWGGDTRELNYHVDLPNQKFGMDFFQVDEKGNLNEGNGMQNEDYYCFGSELLTPADGIITDVINGIRDNKPWSTNPHSAMGNAVIIKHQEHEFTAFFHLKLDSMLIRVGDKVKKGDVIGLCGNSGNSDRPHLHFQLQNTDLLKNATTIKCYFEKVHLIKGAKKELTLNYTPIKGNIISQ